MTRALSISLAIPLLWLLCGCPCEECEPDGACDDDVADDDAADDDDDDDAGDDDVGDDDTSSWTGLPLVSSGTFHSCVVWQDNSAECWGMNSDGATSVPDVPFRQVVAGGFVTCGITWEDTIECFGDNEDGIVDAPEGTFTQLDMGNYHACAVATDGTVACWGLEEVGETEPPDDDTFVQVSCGYDHSCGLHEDGSVSCWGEDLGGNTIAPNIEFDLISVGFSSSCGLTAEGEVVCWDIFLGGINHPMLHFDLGTQHGCGARLDSGGIECWGNNADGQANEPDGAYVQVASGSYHTCAVAIDGTINCWGCEGDWSDQGQCDPPEPPAL